MRETPPDIRVYAASHGKERRAMGIPARIDHVVITVQDNLDAAAATYARLGFALTERGHHTLGSSNNLTIFGTDYLELLGWEKARVTEPPAGLASRPPGLAGLALKPPAEIAVDAALAAAGVASDLTREFSRPVRLADGITPDARFRVTQVALSETPFGQVFFCHHFTPDMVWRPEWRSHPNGAIGIAELVIAAHDPAASAAVFGRMFGAAALSDVADGVRATMADGAALLCLTPAAAARRFADALAPFTGAAAMVGLTLRSRDVAATQGALGGIAARAADGRLVVPASAACGVALAFVD